MNRYGTNFLTGLLGFAVLAALTVSENAIAQSVNAQLSTREAYVGQPLIFQIQVTNANDFDPPEMPEIDGCDVRSAGRPSRSSKITIFNGRRSESQSVTFQFLITPRREGRFEIPALDLMIDGKPAKTRPLRFVATKSETGDLLFVEVEGKKNKVYVGQPLELTLKIWIKPFSDRQRGIKLSEADMWQLVSVQSSWGVFEDRLNELAKNNQRPRGREVLRDDGEGNERAYYLYEIETTVYPTRSGKIAGDNLQIVVNYPTELGRSRDPFADVLDESPFGRDPLGGNSLLKQMLDDDFFNSHFGRGVGGGSPFGNRLAISKHRPIAADASVDDTEIVPVPTAGRPADYRGAVGKYQIATQATPTRVSAGDPIELNIGIAGSGPMELVQAPPLDQLASLTDDFKISDQSLAGFVQDDTKIFSTTIRPRREGIVEIPAIPFSFFDPETEQFRTVLSEPISITVDKAEALSIDSIVGNPRKSATERSSSEPEIEMQPDFRNHDLKAALLVSQGEIRQTQWWIWCLIVPPVVWLFSLLLFRRGNWSSWFPKFGSPGRRFQAQLARAATPRALIESLIRYIAEKTHHRCEDTVTALGALRTSGLYETANEVEALFERWENGWNFRQDSDSMEPAKQEAFELLEKMETAFARSNRLLVRRADSKGEPAANRSPKSVAAVRHHTLGMVLVLGASLNGSRQSMAEIAQTPDRPPTNPTATESGIELSETQRAVILDEATELYRQAREIEATDSAEAKNLFAESARKYQLVAETVSNSKLFFNLGNAYLKSGDLGRAFANFERARRLEPFNHQIEINQNFVASLIAGDGSQDQSLTLSSQSNSQMNSQSNSQTNSQTNSQLNGDVRSADSKISWLIRSNGRLHAWIGRNTVIAILAVASALFWGLMIARTAGLISRSWGWAVVPLMVLIASTFSMAGADFLAQDDFEAVAIAETIEIRAGDGTQFKILERIKPAIGKPLQVISSRGQWYQIRTSSGSTGWVPSAAIELLNL